MKPSKASAALWDRANKRTAARHGLPGSDPGDAKHEILTVKQLIASIGKNPNALELLAARSHELSPAQRLKALKAFEAAAPKARKAEAAPKASPPAPSRLSRTLAAVGLYGKSGTGAPRS